MNPIGKTDNMPTMDGFRPVDMEKTKKQTTITTVSTPSQQEAANLVEGQDHYIITIKASYQVPKDQDEFDFSNYVHTLKALAKDE